MSRTCPSCGAEVSDTAKFCRGCGAPVTPGDETPKVEAPDLARSCPACGAELVPGARFCHMCATAAPPPPRPARIDCPGCGREVDGSDAFCRYCGGSTAGWGPDQGAAEVRVPSGHAHDRSGSESLQPEPRVESLVALRPESAASDAEATDVTTEPAPSDEQVPAPTGAPATDELTSIVPESAVNSFDPATGPLWSGTAPALDDESVVLDVNEPDAGAPRVTLDAPAPATVDEDGNASAEGDAAGEQATIVSSDPGNGALAAPNERLCGACQKPVSVAARHCRSCGASLEDFEATVVMAPTQAPNCASCGREIEGWAQFCRHCGARLATEGADATSQAADGACQVCGAAAAGGSSLCVNCAEAVGA